MKSMKSVDAFLNKLVKYNKQGQILCILLILFSIFVIFSQYQKTGNLVVLGMDFTGGSEAEVLLDKKIMVDQDVILNIEKQISLISESQEAQVRFSSSASGNSISIITKNPIKAGKIISILKENSIEITSENIQQNYISSGLSADFLKQAQKALKILNKTVESKIIGKVYEGRGACHSLIGLEYNRY